MITLPPGFWHEYRLYFFVLENLAIVTGYAFLALFVVPRVSITLRRTRIGGIGFFLTCATTHLDQALHSAFEADEKYGTIAAEWHMLLVHGAQVLFVIMFVSGLYVEFVEWGPWALRKDRRHRQVPVLHERRRARKSVPAPIVSTTPVQDQGLDRTESP